MPVIELRDRERLQVYFQRDLPLFLYCLGDLDDFFFPHTRWYALADAGSRLQAVALRYTASQPEVLLALASPADRPAMQALIRQLQPELPGEIYTHLTPGLEPALQPGYSLSDHGLHWKMQLVDPELPAGPFPRVTRLDNKDSDHLATLYASHYPDHAYDPRMLETGQYFGIHLEGRLVCAAGVHVYSPRYGVAALGNVVTHQAYRGRGLARQAVAALCRSLLHTVQHIGLNVKADNRPAVRLYESLGFVRMAEYHEYTARRRSIQRIQHTSPSSST